MFGISGFELLIILALMLIIFGPDKLPQLARTIGQAMKMFKRAQEDMERVIRAEMYTSDSKMPLDVTGLTSAKAETPAAPKPADTANSIWASTDEDDEEDEE